MDSAQKINYVSQLLDDLVSTQAVSSSNTLPDMMVRDFRQRFDVAMRYLAEVRVEFIEMLTAINSLEKDVGAVHASLNR